MSNYVTFTSKVSNLDATDSEIDIDLDGESNADFL